MNLILLSVVCFVGLLDIVVAELGKETVEVIDLPSNKQYKITETGSDKHDFGYQVLKDTTNFHHTTTEDDGVRLGCYGHKTSGKMYYTEYVADAKGYRTVSSHDVITVYPKSGGERKASFTDGFNQSKLRNLNIRYYFPEACNGLSTENTKVTPPPPTPATTPKTTTTTRTTTTTTPKTPMCVKSCCSDDESIPKLVLPIPMKNLGGFEDSCEKFAKLIIPASALNSDTLRSLGSDNTELIKNALKLLS